MRATLPLMLLLAATPAAAAVALPVTVEALARQADAVVRGKVEKRESRWAEDGRHIFTFVTVRVGRVWRGEAPGQVVLRIRGGEVGDTGQRVDGEAVFGDGEEVVVFLVREDGGTFRVHGLGLGKFKVEGGEAKPDLGHFTFKRGLVPPEERQVEAMPIAELERRVRGLP
jgi:hypothetical protein